MTAVFFAISITALLAVASLVLGSSTGYTSERNGQNAADAAALAATSKLRDVAQDTAAPWEVYVTARDVAQDNGADLGSVDCDLVNRFYAVTQSESDVIAPCFSWSVYDPQAAGVRVKLTDTSDVPFGGAVDQDEITANVVAAASVQPLRGGFRAPFMLCANALDHGVDLLVDDPSVDPPYLVNEDAFGVEFLLWSNGNGFGDRNCGVSAWHGLVNSDLEYQMPSDPDDDDGWWDIDTGSRVGHIERLLAGDDACDWATDADIDAAAGCRLALPLCVETVGNGTNVRLNCVRLAVFEITYVGDGDEEGSCVSVNKKVVCGRLIPGGVATGGQGTLDPADPNELVLIKLVQ